MYRYLFGSNNNDSLVANPYYMYKMYGYDGNDFIKGGNLNDILFGGWGNDSMFGGYGDDWLYGEGGMTGFMVAMETIESTRGRATTGFIPMKETTLFMVAPA